MDLNEGCIDPVEWPDSASPLPTKTARQPVWKLGWNSSGKCLGQTWKTHTKPPQAAEAQTSPREVRTNEHSRHERCLKTLCLRYSASVRPTWFLGKLQSLAVLDRYSTQTSQICKVMLICQVLAAGPLGPQPDMITEPKAPLLCNKWQGSPHITHLAKSAQEQKQIE